MQFRTEVVVAKGDFEIGAAEQMLFVGSCFADNLGKRFRENAFPAVVNPYGVMYNPASILHTVERWLEVLANASEQPLPRVAIFTLGTNHVYILKETGEIVDNCQKRPQRLFEERELSVDECADYLQRALHLLKAKVGDNLHVILTVSPIRYAKYGFHGSQLSKATLQLAAEKVRRENPGVVSYFPAYEILNDELRDYRFYQEDMLHPSDQAVEYIWQKFREAYFSKEAKAFMEEWRPIREALGHRPFNPESEEYQKFLAQAKEKERLFKEKYKL